MQTIDLKPMKQPVQHDCAALRQFDHLGLSRKGATKSAAGASLRAAWTACCIDT